MISHVLDKISFWSLFIVVVLLPVFFLPFSKIPIETSKGFLLVIGLAISIIFWTAARFSDGKIAFPRSKLLLAGLGIVLAFLISAIFSSVQQMSFFGIMFDIGTFWFMVAAFLLMLVSSVVLKDKDNARKVFLGLVTAFIVVFLFQVLRVSMPETTSFGLFTSKTGNLIGSWVSLGLFAGLVGVMSLFAIEFFSLSKSRKIVLKIALALSMILIIVVNSALIWKMVGLFALVIFVYKISASFGNNNQEGEESRKGHFPVVSLGVVMVSLLFFMAGQFIGSALPNRLGLSNIEISPSFGATMSVAKATIAKDPILGIGPNRFGEAWSTYRPIGINTTQFWDVSFDSGSGLLPTFAATTGIVGIIAWLVFIILFILSGFKSIFSNIKDNINSDMAAFFVASLYLLVAAMFYAVGPVLFLLVFAFIGAFIGLSNSGKENGEVSISFFGSPKKSFISILLLVVVMVASAAAGFKYVERLASVSYFGSALRAQTIESAETSIGKAISLYQNDLYLRTYAQVYLIKLNSLASKGAELTETEKADLQLSFDRAVGGATLATASNKNNYVNFRTLGSVYETVGSYGVVDAYTKAMEAYQSASLLSPLNPGLKLAAARVAFVEGKLKEAREFANQSLELKQNYIDALVLLSQIAKAEGNTTEAISYAEKALSFSPTNNDLIQYVNSLKGVTTPNSN